MHISRYDAVIYNAENLIGGLSYDKNPDGCFSV